MQQKKQNARSTAGILQQLEIFAGSVASGLVSATVIIGSLMIGFVEALSSDPLSKKIGIVAVAMTALALEGRTIVFFYRRLKNPRGVPLLELASHHPRWPLFLRPIPVIWWLSHFVMLSLVAETILHTVQLICETTYQRAALVVIEYLIYVGASFGSNAFLLLSVAALSRESPLLRIIYRVRLLIDAVVAAALILFPIPFKWLNGFF